MSAEVPFLPETEAEFLAEVDFYNGRVPALGAGFVTEVEDAVGRIARHPEAGSPYLAGTRRVVLNHFPYSVVYRARAGTLLIVAVAHHSREPGYWQDRL